MEEIRWYTGLSPAAFFTILLLILMVELYRTFVAMKNSSNTNAQPIHQGEVTSEHQLTGSPSQLSLLGSTQRTTSSTAFQGASSSSSSSSSIHPWRYDVFLNFRGVDTRHNFTAHLHQALLQKGINTFFDDDLLRSGEEISLGLLKAIEESKISIVVLSPAYASSLWCLEELVKILECKEKNGQRVIPVFYKINPADVRKQRNSFAEAFAKHEERLDDIRVWRWKAALADVANLAGWHLDYNENEAKFIYNIVQNVSGLFSELKVGKSFVESSSCTAAGTVGLQLLSSQVLDLFPVTSCFEMGNAGVELHSAVNCYEMESASLQHCLSSPVAAVAKVRRNKTKRHLGHICAEPDRILGGLVQKPKGKRFRVGSMGYAGPKPKGKRVKYRSVSVSVSRSVCRDSSLVLDPEPSCGGWKSSLVAAEYSLEAVQYVQSPPLPAVTEQSIPLVNHLPAPQFDTFAMVPESRKASVSPVAIHNSPPVKAGS